MKNKPNNKKGGITEEKCRNSLFNFLYNKIKEDKSFINELQKKEISIFIGREVPVPYRHIYSIVDNLLNLEIMCFDQDIAFFDFFKVSEKKLNEIEIKIISNRNLSKKNIKSINGPENKKISADSKFLVFPYVTIEAKMRKKDKKKDEPTTDSILATSKKVELIKSIFPHCKLMLLIFLPKNLEIPQRVYRCGKPFFDEILGLEFSDENDKIKFEEDGEKGINAIKYKIEKLIEESINDLQNLNKKGV